MKTTTVFALLLSTLLSTTAFAQITTREVAEKEYPKPQPWDSLTFPSKGNDDFYKFKAGDFEGLIGQSFYYPAKSKKDKTEAPIGSEDFAAGPFFPNTESKEAFYHSVLVAQGQYQYSSKKWAKYGADYKIVTNQNFTILDVLSLSDSYICFKLLHPTLKDTAYYRFNPYRDYHFMIVGNFEKLKKSSVGQTYVFVGGIYTFGDQAVETNDANTGKPVIIAQQSEWTCMDYTLVELEISNDPIPVYFFKNKAGEEIMVVRGGNKDIPARFGEFKSKKLIEQENRDKLKKAEQLEKERKLQEAEDRKVAEALKREYIAKYGSKYGGLIAQGKVVIGMTKDMSRDAWGEPLRTNSTITAGGHREQWVYSLKTYLYFEGDKLVAIQN